MIESDKNTQNSKKKVSFNRTMTESGHGGVYSTRVSGPYGWGDMALGRNDQQSSEQAVLFNVSNLL